MVTKTYLPSNLCDSSNISDNGDNSDSCDSSDSSDSSHSSDSSDQKNFFFTKKKLCPKKIPKITSFQKKLFLKLFLTIKKFTKNLALNCDETQKLKL